MIGKPEWFKRRKYGGWGIYPKTWQGWVYLAAVITPFAVFNALPFWSEKTRMIVTLVWLAFLAIDISHIMIKMKKDERERIHEAIAERNALWVMIAVIVIGIGYQTARASVLQNFTNVDWFLVAALFAAVITKAITNIYLDRKD
ncbi:MAG: hypothetical protein PHO02_00685 [Candidatus Nanoarchaeia archaeon]|nr:hypothetical protein [Candidatus Nanoarchaeia archaeon]